MTPLRVITFTIFAVVICSLEFLSGQAKRITLLMPLDTSVCELVNDSQKFDGKAVRFPARFQSDGIHSSVLTESGCSRGIIPFFPDEIEHHPDIEALDVALAKGMRGTMDKRIVGTFTGKFIIKKDRSSRPLLALEISKFENLQVSAVDLKPHLPK